MNLHPSSSFARAACAALIATVSVAAQAHVLTVEVLNARSDQGNVAGALYGSEASWLKESLRGERQPAGEKVVLVYRDLEAGHYALSVFHDENANGKLDSNVVGIPTERYGFSRDARGHMAAPTFGDASVELTADTTITIHLR
ncbi:MAG: DUF2141 domain-containing protein [Rhizobacter sp.]|nr:DUF2141 domain-containing protein [Rhizobacter sp.]